MRRLILRFGYDKNHGETKTYFMLENSLVLEEKVPVQHLSDWFYLKKGTTQFCMYVQKFLTWDLVVKVIFSPTYFFITTRTLNLAVTGPTVTREVEQWANERSTDKLSVAVWTHRLKVLWVFSIVSQKPILTNASIESLYFDQGVCLHLKYRLCSLVHITRVRALYSKESKNTTWSALKDMHLLHCTGTMHPTCPNIHEYDAIRPPTDLYKSLITL